MIFLEMCSGTLVDWTLGAKHCFCAGPESGTKSRKTLNTKYDLKITGINLSHIKIGKFSITKFRQNKP